MQLRIYNPDAKSPTQNTLTALFEKEILPRRPFWDPRTLAEYNSTIHLWEEITGDPPVSQIDDRLITQFAAGLAARKGKAGRGLSRNTIRKHLRHLRAMLRLLGPRATRGIGLLAELPVIEWPRPAMRPITTFTMNELRALRDAASDFQTPLTAPIPSDRWWIAMVTVLYNTSWRIGTALQLRWEWIQGNLAVIPAEAHKRGDAGRRYYLNTHARQALNSIHRKDSNGLVFPWNGAILSLQRWRRRIARKCGIPDDELHGFHCIRRTALSEIAKLNPLVARIMAGHAIHDVLAEHYISDDVIASTLEQLPQPW